jgi:hypothetical protein
VRDDVLAASTFRSCCVDEGLLTVANMKAGAVNMAVHFSWVLRG